MSKASIARRWAGRLKVGIDSEATLGAAIEECERVINRALAAERRRIRKAIKATERNLLYRDEVLAAVRPARRKP